MEFSTLTRRPILFGSTETLLLAPLAIFRISVLTSSRTLSDFPSAPSTRCSGTCSR